MVGTNPKCMDRRSGCVRVPINYNMLLVAVGLLDPCLVIQFRSKVRIDQTSLLTVLSILPRNLLANIASYLIMVRAERWRNSLALVLEWRDSKYLQEHLEGQISKILHLKLVVSTQVNLDSCLVDF